MKKIFLILSICFIHASLSFSQKEPMDFIVLKTSVVDNSKLTSNQLQKLKLRATQIATNYGYSAVENQHHFSLAVDFQVYDEATISGIRQSVAINGEVMFTVSNTSSGIQYSSLIYRVSGIGNNYELAISNGIKKISTRNKDFEIFFAVAESKIFDFYNSNCENIIANASRNFDQQNYTKTIAELSSIPSSVSSCQKQAKDLLQKAYLNFQNKNCQQLLLKAKSRISNNDYKSALKLLSYIDPESDCFDTALNEIKTIEGEIDEKDLKEWNFKIQKYADIVELEKHRIEAVKEIGKAYYENKSDDFVLNMIVIK